MTSEWKAIVDELPPVDVDVLVYGPLEFSKDCGMCVYRRYECTNSRIGWNCIGVDGYEWDVTITPTHWMPLPKAPNAA